MQLTALSLALTRVGLGGFAPSSLFLYGEQGAWYDPSDIRLGWRYNLLTKTEQFDDSEWTKAAATTTPNTLVAPDGTSTADTVTASSAFGSVRQTSATTASMVTVSIYAKQASFSRIELLVTNSTVSFANFAAALFDLATGTYVSQRSGGTGYAISSYSITDAGNGWYRCVVTATVTAGSSQGFAAGLSSAAVNGSSIYIWGAQLETGSTASTYQRITDGVQDYYTYQPQPVMFQDSAGTTPVTAVEQPVGLMLDKSKGLVLGPELVTNASIDGLPAGGGARTYSTGATVAANRWYVIEADVTDYVGTSIVGFSTSNGVFSSISALSGNGKIRQYRFTGASGTVNLFTLDTNTANFRNISIRELPGNHAFQTTTTSRPVLSARYNLLTRTEQFDDAAWAKLNATVTPNVAVAPDGTLTADLIDEGTTTSNHYLFQTSISHTSGVTYTTSVYLKAGTVQWIQIPLSSSSFGLETWANFDLVNGVVGNRGANATPSIQNVGNGWYRCTITAPATLTGNSAVVQVAFCGNTNTASRLPSTTGNNLTFYIWGASLTPANQASLPYQRVNTSTDYDADPAKFPVYLRFDGVDDWLQTNSIDFTATDKMTVFAGVRKLSDATLGMALELSASTTTNTGVFYLAAPLTAGAANYAFSSKGTSQPAASYTNSAVTAPTTDVLTGIGDISGDQVALRVDGTQVASSTVDQGTGNYGNHPLYIGRRGGTSLPFNGQIYSLIVRGAQTSTTQIAQTERWVAGKTGVTL